jgi:hypothetical protein
MMPNYGWILVGMASSGIGGAFGAWLPLAVGAFPPDGVNLTRVVLYCALVTALFGGLASVGRGGRLGWGSRLYCALAIGAAVCLLPLVVYLVFLLLPALLVGLIALAATWIGLAACGVRASRASS